jgi:hypothetical protein
MIVWGSIMLVQWTLLTIQYTTVNSINYVVLPQAILWTGAFLFALLKYNKELEAQDG